MSRMLQGSPLLMGDNTIPGLKIHTEVEEQIETIKKAVRDFGCDFFEPIIVFLTYDEISEIAAYGGFTRRYPHWQFGMEYEELSRGYEHNMHRISEMVINANPCLIYCLDSNTLVDNIDVIAHALFHSDFFKNNVFFEKTDRGMFNKMANHGTMIRDYMSKWGKEKVTAFIDRCLMIDTLIDPSKAWEGKLIRDPVIRDKKKTRSPRFIESERDYMDPWLNPDDFLKKEYERIRRKEAAEELGLFGKPEKDIFGFIKNHAPLKGWQQDIIAMLYDEAMYFAPQRATKAINEGWASYGDYKIMAECGLSALGQKGADCGIIEYAKHKMQVLGGKYSMNPYKLGFELLMDIEDRWNKGKFGPEYNNCEDIQEKEKWDKKLGLGKEKVFEVRACYNDFMLISEFFTPEFCEDKEFFEYQKLPNGDYVISNRDHAKIKDKLLKRYMNGGLPDVRVTDANGHGRGWLVLQHYWDGRPLYDSYAKEVLRALQWFWKENVILSTKNIDEEDIVYVCDGQDVDRNIHLVSQKEYESEVNG